jgi:hypothetical protein
VASGRGLTNTWSRETKMLENPTGNRGTAGIPWFPSPDGYSRLRLGFDDRFNPVVELDGPLWGSLSETDLPPGRGTSLKRLWVDDDRCGQCLLWEAEGP